MYMYFHQGRPDMVESHVHYKYYQKSECTWENTEIHENDEAIC